MNNRSETSDQSLLTSFFAVPTSEASEILLEARTEALYETKLLLKEQLLQAILELALTMPIESP